MKNATINGAWKNLAAAVIERAYKDINSTVCGIGACHRRDAKEFLQTDWCQTLQDLTKTGGSDEKNNIYQRLNFTK